MKCSIKNHVIKKVCVGDLNTPVTLQTREHASAKIGEVNPTETFTNLIDPLWTFCETLGDISFERAQMLFNGISMNDIPTHIFYCLYDPELKDIENGNNFILYNDMRYKVVSINNSGENNSIMMIFCKLTGVTGNTASKA